jgi:hypothetical protein
MEAAAVNWLDQVGAEVFWISASLFISINCLFAASVYKNRDREFVNRWTGRLLAVDLLLIGSGVGVPVLAATARFTISAVAPAIERTLPSFEAHEATRGGR